MSPLLVPATCRLSVYYTRFFVPATCRCDMSLQHDPSCLPTFISYRVSLFSVGLIITMGGNFAFQNGLGLTANPKSTGLCSGAFSFFLEGGRGGGGEGFLSEFYCKTEG